MVNQPHSTEKREKVCKKDAGQRLRATRLALGFQTVREFAAKTGVEEDTLSSWERGQNKVPDWYVILLYRRFRVTMEWIYGGDKALLPYELAEKLEEPGQAA